MNKQQRIDVENVDIIETALMKVIHVAETEVGIGIVLAATSLFYLDVLRIVLASGTPTADGEAKLLTVVNTLETFLNTPEAKRSTPAKVAESKERMKSLLAARCVPSSTLVN